MAAECTLAPFTASGLARQPEGTWIANTTLYRLGVHSEEGRPTINSNSERPACISSVVDGDFNNQTIGDLPLLNSGVFSNLHIRVKTFSAVHLGRHNYDDGYYYGERREWCHWILLAPLGTSHSFQLLFGTKRGRKIHQTP
jgi:hypothetical protein